MFLSKLKTVALALALATGVVFAARALHVPAGEPVAGKNDGLRPVKANAALTLVPVDEAAELVALIDKGIKSAGGLDKLAKFTAGSCKITGKAVQNEVYSLDGFVQGLDQLKVDGDMERDGMQQKLTMVLSGDEAWAMLQGRVREAPKEAVAGLKEVIRVFRYVHVLTPLKDKDVTLSPLGEVNINGQDAVALKVACKDQKDVHLFLDKATGLPLRAEFKIINNLQAEETVEFTFSDYKEFNSRKHFTKVELKLEGRAIMEAELSDFRWLDMLEAGVFERPQ
jgi:hypothetical protein